MQTLDIREVQTQLSKLIEQAAQGDTFIIAKAGKPLVKVERLEAEVQWVPHLEAENQWLEEVIGALCALDATDAPDAPDGQ